MTEKIKEIIQNRDIVIPRLLFMNYKNIDLTEQELILIIYILNTTEIFNPKQISNDLNISLNNVMELMEDLTAKGIIKLELKKIGNIRNEYMNLDGLYEKLTFKILNKEEPEKKSSIYSIFEEEFGRPISAMEVEIISAWIEHGTNEETIKLALKEATYNGVNNLRYIDRIISDWSKKGIK